MTSSTSNGATAPVNPQIRVAWFTRRALLKGRVWSCILLFLVAISGVSTDTDIYVSSKRGSDSHGDGSFQRPFASLQRGQRAVRDIVTHAQEGNIVVNEERVKTRGRGSEINRLQRRALKREAAELRQARDETLDKEPEKTLLNRSDQLSIFRQHTTLCCSLEVP